MAASNFFSLGKKLGEGGYAVVHEALPKGGGKAVALKQAKTRNVNDLRRLRREIEIQTHLKHPHVMPVLRADPLFRWYAMPLAVGNLMQLCGDLQPDEFRRLLRQVALGLEAGHRIGAFHRDVTPRNILKLGDDHDARWVIADWGVATRPNLSSDSLDTRTPVGTDFYMAPELRLNPKVASERSDIYSLGLVARTVKEWRGWDAAAGIDRFIERSARLDPSQRPSSVGEVSALLADDDVRAPRRFFFVCYSDNELLPQGLRSALVKLEDGKCLVIGERPGAWCASEQGPRRCIQKGRQVLIPKYPARSVKEGAESVIIQELFLENIATGSMVRLSSPSLDDEDDGYWEFERSYFVWGGAGSLLFIAERTSVMGVGAAHPNVWSRFIPFDVLSEHEAEEFLAGNFIEAAGAEEARAQQLFIEQGLETVGEDDTSLFAYRPIFEPDGRVVIEYVFLCFASYAGGDKVWDAYTRSTEVVAPSMPIELSRRVQPPPPVARFIGAQYGRRCRGWSELGTHADSLGAVELFLRTSG